MNHKKKSVKTTERKDRRSFLARLSSIIGTLAVVEFFGIGIAFLKSKPRKTQAETTEHFFEAGHTTDFKPGSVTPFAGARFYLVRLMDGGFLALSLRCSHLGCSIHWNTDKDSFICPCHASRFDITGNVLSPPAPHALDYYPLEISANIVRVNTTRIIKRSSFEKSQVVYG